jgi:hypothetical protein
MLHHSSVSIAAPNRGNRQTDRTGQRPATPGPPLQIGSIVNVLPARPESVWPKGIPYNKVQSTTFRLTVPGQPEMP